MKVKAKLIQDSRDNEDGGYESEDSSIMSGEEIKVKGKTSNQFNFALTFINSLFMLPLGNSLRS